MRLLLLLRQEGSFYAPLLDWVVFFVEKKSDAILILVAAALLLGLIKGRTLIAKMVDQVADRLYKNLAFPFSFFSFYGRRQCFLILSMMIVGMVIRFIPVPSDIHGCIDLAVGSSLICGAVAYFRNRFFSKQLEG